MMPWNHRVLRKIDPKTSDVYFEIHEIHYNIDGKIEGWTESSVAPLGETLQILVKELHWFLDACSKPVLEVKTIDGKETLVEATESKPEKDRLCSKTNFQMETTTENTSGISCKDRSDLKSDDIGSKSQQYRIEVFYSCEDQAYIAAVPAFDRVSAHGETAAQAVFEVQNALEAVIDIMTKDGVELPLSDLG